MPMDYKVTFVLRESMHTENWKEDKRVPSVRIEWECTKGMSLPSFSVTCSMKVTRQDMLHTLGVCSELELNAASESSPSSALPLFK